MDTSNCYIKPSQLPMPQTTPKFLKVWPLMCFSKQKPLPSSLPVMSYLYILITLFLFSLGVASNQKHVVLEMWNVFNPKVREKNHLPKSFQKRICGTCILLYSHGFFLCYNESTHSFPWVKYIKTLGTSN